MAQQNDLLSDLTNISFLNGVHLKTHTKCDLVVSVIARTHVIDSQYLSLHFSLFIDFVKPEDTREDGRDLGKTGATSEENKERAADCKGLSNPYQ